MNGFGFPHVKSRWQVLVVLVLDLLNKEELQFNPFEDRTIDPMHWFGISLFQQMSMISSPDWPHLNRANQLLICVMVVRILIQ